MTKKRLRIVISLSLIVLTVGFIWINSAIPGKDSGELSGWFRDFLGKVLGTIGFPADWTLFLTEHVRKVAHAVEYNVIGLELGLLWVGLENGVQGFWNSWSGVLAVAVFDETIQLFATDRGPQIQDVLLDTAAGTVGILFVYIIWFIAKCIIKSRKKQ